MIYSHKKCKKCGEEKKLKYFHDAPQLRDGLNKTCKACLKIRSPKVERALVKDVKIMMMTRALKQSLKVLLALDNPTNKHKTAMKSCNHVLGMVK